jgi:hypothetical protein
MRGPSEEKAGATRLALPGGGELFTAPAVWRRHSSTTVFIGDEHAAAYALIDGRLHLVWENSTPGTSPVMAGGLLYVYNPTAGGVCLRAALCSPDREAPRHRGPLEQPDRRRRTRDRARGRCQ